MTLMRKIQRGDLRLAVEIEGPEGKPWLLAMHSVATSGAIWGGCLPALTQTHRLILCDARGHGRSSAPPGPYGFADLVGDAIAVLDDLEIDRCDVLGLSMGGMTALGMGLDHPDRVGRLICANARADFPPAVAASWATRAAAVAAGGMGAIADETLTRWFAPATHAQRPALVDAARRLILSTDPEGYRGCAAALEQLNYRSRLGDMRVPVLYIAGAEDMAAPAAAMAEMAAATPGARLEVMPGVAHLSAMEAPSVFARLVAGFLDKGPEVLPSEPADGTALGLTGGKQ
jgi:3-oxoadipate enol-lactonase